LSAPVWPTWLTPAPPTQSQIATLDAAQTLNLAGNSADTSALQAAAVQGTIVNQHGGGGVNWYTFTLTQPSEVQLTTLDVGGESRLDGVVSLYDTEAQDFLNPPINYNYSAPPFDPMGHRLMAQVDTAPTSDSSAYIDRDLAPGTYYVAVSGHGDTYFNPFLADSGYAGSTGDYCLLITASPLPVAQSDGPEVLAVDSGLLNGPGLFPAQSGTSVLISSPSALYVDFSSPIDPGTVSLQQFLGDGSSVQLTYNPTGQFGNGNDSPVLLNGFHYAPDAMELQLQPAAPLAPGFYQLTLAGNSSSGNQVLMDPTDSVDLGQNSANPTGQDFATTFQIAGTPGVTPVSDDTAATAQNLGNITRSGVVQAVGAIGNDPAYSPFSFSPNLTNPASQVDLYQFQISGPGNYEFSAEAFAGRIGSTLDPALSLFRIDPSNTQSPLQLVASNDGSGNQTVSSNGQFLPLLTDPVLDVGLTAGVYYVAVSSLGNMPDVNGNPPGTNGIFDPNVTESGVNGTSTGPYVLNVLVQPAAPAPHVVSTSIPAGATLTAAPTQLTVTFNSTVNLVALANQADSGAVTTEPTFASVFIVEPNGQQVFPGLLSYDAATNEATFLLLDRLPNGVNQLHLSGANGLTGLGGNPLTGNDASGDYVVSFSVADPAAPADPLNRIEGTLNNAPNAVQDLGVFFPNELQNGVTITGTLAPSASSDTYKIQLLASQDYLFTLNGPPLVPGGPLTSPSGNLQMTITDATGAAVVPLFNGNADALLATLSPGSYTIQISQSSGDTPLAAPYAILITMLNTHDNPPPLTVGAAPVLQLRAISDPPATGLVSAPPTPGTPGGTGLAAISLRADLAGGITTTTTGSSLAAAAPLQLQGLGNGPASLASNVPAVGAPLFTFAVLTKSDLTAEVATDGVLALMNVLSASWSEWRWEDFISRAASPSNAVPQRDSAQANGVPARNPGTSPEGIPGAPFAAGPAPGVSEWLDGTTMTTSSNDVQNSAPIETGPSPWTLIGALFTTVLAAFLVWGRRRPASEPNSSLKRRATDVADTTVRLAN
jgi:hypothetical protein